MSGDGSAFADLVDPMALRLAQIAAAIVGNEADAGDAMQDALTIAWQQMRRLRDPERFQPWLTRILVNECRRVARARRQGAVREVSLWPDSVANDGMEDAVVGLLTLERAFNRLNVDQRTLLVLHYLQDASVDEIAQALDIKPGTAKSRLFAARRALESVLELEDGREVR